MPITFVGDKDVVTAQDIVDNLHWLSPHASDSRGRILVVGTVRSQTAIDMSIHDNQIKTRFAFLQPHYYVAE